MKILTQNLSNKVIQGQFKRVLKYCYVCGADTKGSGWRHVCKRCSGPDIVTADLWTKVQDEFPELLI